MTERTTPPPELDQSLPSGVLHVDDPYPESLAEFLNETALGADTVSLQLVQYTGQRAMHAVTFTPQETIEHPEMFYSATGDVVVPDGIRPALKTMGLLQIPTDPELPIVITLDT